jgi:hypothetical protein
MVPFRWMIFAAALAAAPVASTAATAGAKPSRAPEKGCAWEKLSNAAVGLDAWVQRCDFGFRKIDFVWSAHSLAQRFDAGKPDPQIDVLDLAAGEPVDAGLVRLFRERTDKALAAKCVLQAYKYFKPDPKGVKRFTFVPNAQFQKKLDAERDPNDVPDPPCGDWGDAPDGIQYFEVQANSQAARRVLFVRIGQDEPLYDEQSLKILPAP